MRDENKPETGMNVKRGFAGADITALSAIRSPARSRRGHPDESSRRSARERALSAARGFTLLEATTVLVIVGLLFQALITGQQLIQNARVRHIMSQQDAVESAFEGFQDRFRAPPGDYSAASINIDCGPVACLDGNGDGHIEAGTGGAPHEEILVWQHLGAAGFLEGRFYLAAPGVSTPAPDNTPRNVFGGYLQIGYDALWGYSGNASPRHTIKTGNHVPASVLEEVDRKVDDDKPGTGRFQFSVYAGDGAAPPVGGAPNGCTDADTPTASWITRGAFGNCGAATLVR
jgi:hypothetical protein